MNNPSIIINRQHDQTPENYTQSYPQSEHTFSNHSLKVDPQPQPKLECAFCRVRPTILHQLNLLREAVLLKNEKIRELEGFIHKISKMAFTSSTDASDHLASKHAANSLPFQELTFAQCSASPPNHSQANSFHHNDDSLQSNHPHSLSSNEKEQIRNSIKSEVKRLTIDKGDKQLPKQEPLVPRQESGKQSSISERQPQLDYSKLQLPRQSPLRAKLLSIMNLLPESQQDSRLQSFQTESEPMGEGVVGLVNSKVSNHKIVKHAGFIKKSEVLSQSFNSTFKSDWIKRNKD